MTGAECLKRVFSIEFETCPVCGEAVRIIACIRDGGMVEKILTYLDAKSGAAEPSRRPLA